MKLSDLLIALRYWVAPELRVMLLGSILLLSFSVQIKNAGADSLNKLSGGKNDYLADSVNSDDKNDLTLRHAISLALLQNPELAAFSKEMRALEGVTLQAGLLRNPELSVNVENIGNIQKLRGDINAPESIVQEVVQQVTTIRIGQLIELGGKRAARVSAALLGEELAAMDYETRRVEIIARVANVFTEVLAAQERLRLAEETRQVAQNVVNSVTKRVQGGKVAPIEETRVRVGLSTTRIEYEQA
ncbi:MAG: TolC family protein, partial [Nitrosomonas sp.]|nr:TolC family protein [Nitrosomonas sp.]